METDTTDKQNTPASGLHEQACSALFIGGPRDGQRMTLPKENPYVQVAVKASPVSGVEVFEYRLVMVSKVPGFALYSDPQMTEEDIFRKLHDGYMPNADVEARIPAPTKPESKTD
jgi:hypothetical protein